MSGVIIGEMRKVYPYPIQKLQTGAIREFKFGVHIGFAGPNLYIN
jgi:hypothetical protein